MDQINGERGWAPEFVSTGGEVVNTHPDESVALKVGGTYARVGDSSFPMRTQMLV